MIFSNLQRVVVFAFMLFLFASCSNKKNVDLLVIHARIYSVDSSFSIAEAMAIKDGKVVQLGTTEDLLKVYQPENLVDAEGHAVYPGLIDAHSHFTGYATDRWKCNLVGTTSYEDVLQTLQNYAATAPGNLLYGRGWDQNDWEVPEYPTREKLDSLFPGRPIFLKRIDGHAAICSSKMLELAGVTEQSAIEGGEFVKSNGELTGLVIDNAMHLVEKIIPGITDEAALKYYKETEQEFFAEGLTGAHDPGVSDHTVTLLQQAYKTQGLKIKIFALLSDNAAYYKKWVASGPLREGGLHVGGFKVYSDGALGSRGACLLHPYSDKADRYGFLLSSKAHFDSLAQMLSGSGLQMCTHAIGDSANRQILATYASVLKGKNDKRWRIEHAQVVNENDFHFFADYNIIPSVQPTHATSDMYWAGDRLGKERLRNAYAYLRLLNTNGWMPLGTDFPVEYLSPIKTFFAATERKDSKGFPATGFQIENALSRQAALRGMTIWAAKAAFEEKEKGSLEPGKSADFIITDTDFMKCSSNDILKTKVLSTYINGDKVYGK